MFLIRLFDRLLAWLERQREYQALAQLDDRQLADLGVTRAEAEARARGKPAPD